MLTSGPEIRNKDSGRLILYLGFASGHITNTFLSEGSVRFSSALLGWENQRLLAAAPASRNDDRFGVLTDKVSLTHDFVPRCSRARSALFCLWQTGHITYPVTCGISPSAQSGVSGTTIAYTYI
jgi:hypothetical protein